MVYLTRKLNTSSQYKIQHIYSFRFVIIKILRIKHFQQSALNCSMKNIQANFLITLNPSNSFLRNCQLRFSSKNKLKKVHIKTVYLGLIITCLSRFKSFCVLLLGTHSIYNIFKISSVLRSEAMINPRNVLSPISLVSASLVCLATLFLGIGHVVEGSVEDVIVSIITRLILRDRIRK